MTVISIHPKVGGAGRAGEGQGIRAGEQTTVRTGGKQYRRDREGDLLRLQRLVRRSASGLGLAIRGLSDQKKL